VVDLYPNPVPSKKRAKSIAFLSGLSPTYTDVVLDGANIVHGGSGNHEINGLRLISAIFEYKSKGYVVHTVLKEETFYYMKKQKIKGFKELNKLVNEGEIILFKKNDDHLAIVLAIEHNAWLITQDTFKSHKEPREREQHPKWFEDKKLDERTRGTLLQSDGWVSSGHDWNVLGNKFYDPDIPDVNFFFINSKENELKKMAIGIERNIDNLQLKNKGYGKNQDQKLLLDNARLEINKYINSFNNLTAEDTINKFLKSCANIDLKIICLNRKIPCNSFVRISKLSVILLRKKLLENNLKSTGNKQDLVNRYNHRAGDREMIENDIIKDINKKGLIIYDHKGLYFNYTNRGSLGELIMWNQMDEQQKNYCWQDLLS